MAKSTIGSEEVLSCIAEKCTAVLQRFDIKPNVIAAASVAVSDGVAAEFGGQLVYFKNQAKLNAEERRLAILSDWESGNFSTGELARKYGLSVQSIYKIIKEKKA
ncbi:Mor transcription activator family protein [Neisseria animalis]|uniref:Mor transcription activator family protein n=1 Tax=Neisseria animalis TaxID=492 RepID=UPI000F6CCF3B|nr:Mor transcription activator family protein [Neisseria animalis]VEE09792.1 putative bacteriophage transcriptional regulator [Neisseria animalis]